MSTALPAPPNPWGEDVWIEMTQPAIWRVGPWGRCIVEAGDDAWPGGKLGAPYCIELFPPEIVTELAPPFASPFMPPFIPPFIPYGGGGGGGSPGGGSHGGGGSVVVFPPGGGGGGSDGTPLAPVALPGAGLLLLAAIVMALAFSVGRGGATLPARG